MRFAKIVFTVAGVWGFLVVTPLYFLFDAFVRDTPPQFTHPDFYFGFLAVTLAWQVAFLIIGRDPIRFRPLMIPAMIEKFGYITTLVALFLQGRIQAGQIAPAVPDGILGLLFLASFMKTR